MKGFTEDLYSILGVRTDATQEKIKQAFRRKAFKTHPDATGDSTTTKEFIRAQNAFDILSDPFRRHEYDAYRPQTQHRRPQFGFGPYDAFVQGQDTIFQPQSNAQPWYTPEANKLYKKIRRVADMRIWLHNTFGVIYGSILSGNVAATGSIIYDKIANSKDIDWTMLMLNLIGATTISGILYSTLRKRKEAYQQKRKFFESLV